jgi:hypothetical protein
MNFFGAMIHNFPEAVYSFRYLDLTLTWLGVISQMVFFLQMAQRGFHTESTESTESTEKNDV